MTSDLEIFVSNDRGTVKLVEFIRNKAGHVYKGRITTLQSTGNWEIFSRTGIENAYQNIINGCSEQLLYHVKQKED